MVLVERAEFDLELRAKTERNWNGRHRTEQNRTATRSECNRNEIQSEVNCGQ